MDGIVDLFDGFTVASDDNDDGVERNKENEWKVNSEKKKPEESKNPQQTPSYPSCYKFEVDKRDSLSSFVTKVSQVFTHSK